jgi:uncharacterized membrane protein YphA (DoxX/SURF4 family)
MKTIFASVVLSIFALSPALACNDRGNCENAPGQLKGAPAPLLGAGLPGLGIAVGYGAYWLARRRRNKTV